PHCTHGRAQCAKGGQRSKRHQCTQARAARDVDPTVFPASHSSSKEKPVLVILGFAMIGVFMTLIMTKRLSPILALILVPTVFGLFAGAGLGIGDMVMDAIASMSSTAALLLFAIIYFGIMIDVGLFDKLVEFILRVAGHDPVRVVLGTAL